MISLFNKQLSERKIEETVNKVISALKEDKTDLAWKELSPLLKAQKTQEKVASSLIQIVEENHLSIEQGLEILESIYNEHKDNIKIVSNIGDALESVRDIDQLNISPPEHPLFNSVVNTLIKALEDCNPKDEELILSGLSTATRMMGRQYDSVAESSYFRLTELDPDYAPYHYCYGLFCKTRGMFKEGMSANQKAASLVEENIDSYQWNLGICATGAGEAEVALKVWKDMGNKIEIGRFNLPDGGYPDCKVRLAERPLAERDSGNDSPGLEETIWIERLSPCHGIIRSVLYQDLGIDYGDVVLMDGAPITYHTYGEQQIPVFPHLATLVKSDYNFFDFAATQEHEGQVRDISTSLSKDAVVYSHTENYQVLCATCWRDPNKDHTDHQKEEKHVVTGRIAAPADIQPSELLDQIDKAISELENCKIYSPQLCELAGQIERAEVEKRRYDMLVRN
ncbi:prenyltransferase [Aliikangiella sp. G2MR2-5]|uniref:prenyltransferase n=1 Tax=Aliikangiella sp. G2MR2-5 TaxID=2788943 RepID=UPI0018AC6EC1|nr:prenyltransferase [Aliikangiella sp. G2MR2-5]